MKVLMISSGFPPKVDAGAEKFCYELSKRLIRTGIELEVATDTLMRAVNVSKYVTKSYFIFSHQATFLRCCLVPGLPRASKEKGKGGKRKRGHGGVRQQLLEPTKEEHIYPERYKCGCCEFKDIQRYYTHQHIELSIYKGKCKPCGRKQKGYVPSEYRTGYGSLLSAFIGELVGIAGNSRRIVQGFCHSVLGLSISLGAIQKVIDWGSEAILPHYEAIRDKARSSKVNHVDETTWYKCGDLYWLWVMVNTTIAFLWFIRDVQKKHLRS